MDRTYWRFQLVFLLVILFHAPEQSDAALQRGMVELSSFAGSHWQVTKVNSDKWDVQEMFGITSAYYVGNAHRVDARAVWAFYPVENGFKSISLNYQYHFRSKELFVPYAGTGAGFQSRGAEVHGKKPFLGFSLGFKRFFYDRISFMVESRGVVVLDEFYSGKKKGAMWHQFAIGFSVLLGSKN